MLPPIEKLIFKLKKKKLNQYLSAINLVDGQVLDVGCGQGYYSELFGKNYTGIDVDAEEIAKAKQAYPNTNFQVMDATDLKFGEKQFDLVFSVVVFHHLNDEEVVKTIKEMSRVVKDEGHILIVDLVLPKRLKFLAFPVFYLDTGSYRRSYEKLADLLSQSGLSPRFTILHRFLAMGIGVFEFEK